MIIIHKFKMSNTTRQKKQSVPSTIMLKDIPGIGTLTQMVSPTPKKNQGTSYMVSRKATTFQRTKMRRIVHQGQPTMTQTFHTTPQASKVKPEPIVFTQLSCDCPTSPSASVIDLISHASDAASELSDDLLSDDLLPEGTITQAMGSPVTNLGPYSSRVTHTQLAIKKHKTLRTSMTSSTFEYGSDWNDAKPGDLVMASAADIGHPAFKQGIIACSYVMLGSVVEFVYVEWDTGMKDDGWDGVVEQHERLNVSWLDVEGVSDDDWCVTPPAPQWVKVIAKKVDDKLKGQNQFLTEEIRNNFFHTKRSGWNAIKRE